MKTIIHLTLAVSLVLSSSARAADTVSIDKVADFVSKQNYLVQENATRLYQAKLSISQARRGLLPSLNIWKVLKVAIDPASLVDVAEDLVPFLVPNNWFRVKENKKIFEMETESYKALWGNEIVNAKILFSRVSTDRQLLSVISFYAQEMKNLVEVARARELMGVIPVGLSKDLEIKLIALQEDERRMGDFVRQETSEMLFQLGVPTSSSPELIPVEMPNWDVLQPIDPTSYEPIAVAKSPELKSFDILLAVLPILKKEIYFSVLGVSTISRGTGGGVFDHLPVTTGLGFGTGPAVKIVKKEVELVTKQREGVLQTLKRQVVNVAANYNSTLVGAKNVNRAIGLANSRLKQLRDKQILGVPIDPYELINVLENHSMAQSKMLEIQSDFLAQQEQFQRLILDGDYKNGPVIP